MTSFITHVMKLLIHSQISTKQLLKFGNGKVISFYVYMRIIINGWREPMRGLKLAHVGERRPSSKQQKRDQYLK